MLQTDCLCAHKQTNLPVQSEEIWDEFQWANISILTTHNSLLLPFLAVDVYLVMHSFCLAVGTCCCALTLSWALFPSGRVSGDPASNLSNGSALIEMVWPCLIRLKKSHLCLSRPLDQVTFVWPCLTRPINLSESRLFPHSSHLRNDEPFKTELIAIWIDSKPDEITWAKLKNEAALDQRKCKEIVLNFPLIMPYPFLIFL